MTAASARAGRDELLLVCGDEAATRTIVELGRASGIVVRAAPSLSEGLSELSASRWRAILLDVELLGGDLGLLSRIVQATGDGQLALLTARPDPEVAMRAIAAGVQEILPLPPEGSDLARVLARSVREGSRIAIPDPAAERETVGSSPALMEVFKVVGRVASSPATVLITGESGTGKELVARAIHRENREARGSFVAVNCAAIPEDLLESELFGHERGAFTGAIARKIGRFERASGGTLFLDEIGDMSLVLQSKILRVLQEREIERLGGEERISVQVRIVAATHRDLVGLVESGEFREDLFYRLSVVKLHLPPLREREGDLRDLIMHYAGTFAREYGREVRYISAPAIERLQEHRWPGNVRELRNVLERAVLVATGDTLRVEDVQIEMRRPTATGELLPGYSSSLTMSEVESLHIEQVLRSVDGHLGRAAEILGMHRNTVSRKAQEYGIPTR